MLRPRSDNRLLRMAAGLGAVAVLAAACSASAAPGTDPPPAPTSPATSSLQSATGTPGATRDSSAFPADVGSPPAARCAPDLRPGWLGRENRRPGVALVRTPDNPAARLYLGTVSATCGQVLQVAVSAPAGRYRLRAVRVGWYGGRGGRPVAVSGSFSAAPQADARGTDHAGSPGWRRTVTMPVGRAWLPGFYLVQLLAGGTPVSSAPLVVLAPASAARAPELFMVAAMTWTAYDQYGGRSLYLDRRFSGRRAVDERARTAALARPVAGAGVTKVFIESASTVRTVERAGVDVDYAPDVDVDAWPSLLRGRAGVMTGSHAEYVTRRIVDAVQAARDAGTNLAFLGGNEFYWQARITRAAGRPVSITVHRDAAEDPAAAAHPDLATVRWRDAPLKRPEARLLGAEYAHLGVVVPLVVQAALPWLGWRPGQLVPAGAASEVDAVVPGVSPPGTQVLAIGWARKRSGQARATVTYYVAASGAAVLDAANVSLGCTAVGHCDRFPVPPAAAAFWSGSVVRIVRSFATPRFGRAHPAAASTTLPSYADLLRRFGPAGVGTSIASDD